MIKHNECSTDHVVATSKNITEKTCLLCYQLVTRQ